MEMAGAAGANGNVTFPCCRPHQSFGYAKLDPVACLYKSRLALQFCQRPLNCRSIASSINREVGSYPTVKEAVEPGMHPGAVHHVASDMIAALPSAFQRQALRIVAGPAVHLRVGDLRMELEAEGGPPIREGLHGE